MRRTFRLLGVALAAGLSLTSCKAADGAKTVDVPAPADAHKGGVLRIGITAPAGVDPLNAYEPESKLISAAMCDTLVSIDPETGQVRAALADRVVQASGTDLTIKLRHGLRFTDGSELKVKDVNYSLQQLIAPANGAYTAGLGELFTPTNTSSSGDVLADPNKLPDVVNSLNSYDMQLVSRSAAGGSLRAFAEPATAPVSRAAGQKDGDAAAANPTCVGPYQLAKPFAPGATTITLKRSTDYYAGNEGYTIGGAGYPDELDFRIYSSTVALLTAYAKGEVDVAQVPSGFEHLVTDKQSLVYGPSTGVEFIGLPLGTDNEYSSVDLRVALSEAVDRTALVKSAFPASAQIANSFFPSSLQIGAGESLNGKSSKAAPLESCTATTPATADEADARAHLDAARRATGKPLSALTLTVNKDGSYPAMANALAQQWKSVLGIEVTVRVQPWTQYVTSATSGTGFDTPFRLRWSSDAVAPMTSYDDPLPYLTGLFGSDPVNGADWGHWDNRGFRFGLTQDAAGQTDVQRRGVAFSRLSTLLCQQLPLIPLAFDRPTFLVRSNAVGSARSTPVGRDGVLLLRDLYLKGTK